MHQGRAPLHDRHVPVEKDQIRFKFINFGKRLLAVGGVSATIIPGSPEVSLELSFRIKRESSTIITLFAGSSPVRAISPRTDDPFPAAWDSRPGLIGPSACRISSFCRMPSMSRLCQSMKRVRSGTDRVTAKGILTLPAENLVERFHAREAVAFRVNDPAVMHVDRSSASLMKYPEKRAFLSVAEHLDHVFQLHGHHSPHEPLLGLKHAVDHFAQFVISKGFKQKIRASRERAGSTSGSNFWSAIATTFTKFFNSRFRAEEFYAIEFPGPHVVENHYIH